MIRSPVVRFVRLVRGRKQMRIHFIDRACRPAARGLLFGNAKPQPEVLTKQGEDGLKSGDAAEPSSMRVEHVALADHAMAVLHEPSEDRLRVLDRRVGAHFGEGSDGVRQEVARDLDRGLQCGLGDCDAPGIAVHAVGRMQDAGDPCDGAAELARPVCDRVQLAVRAKVPARSPSRTRQMTAKLPQRAAALRR
jgi:hypothetical protein